MTSRLLFRRCVPPGTAVQIHEAHDAASALVKARETPPDVIVLDYNLPVGNGVALARELKAAGVEAKYVLLTANTQRAVVQAAQDVGFHAILEKPITNEVVAAVLEALPV
jgi:DNA-binding NarL/FixJ family response regulator